ncbi:MAG: hypothetical protein K2Q06_04330, partial [Parvularculaceae bacterium]|nr:hypothetical protein [Parvularculaceae bacterium]
MLVVEEGALIEAVVAGAPARLSLRTGFFDTLTLNPEFVAAQGLKPNRIRGKSNVAVGGVRVLKGRNATVDYAVAGVAAKGSASWFEDAPRADGDGAFGPFAVPQDVVTIRLRNARADAAPTTATLHGSTPVGGRFLMSLGSTTAGVSIAVERRSPLPIVSAAAGAALVSLYGGVVEGDPWMEEIGMGVARPVRRLVLARPVSIGPFRFESVAVRV